MMEPNTLPAVAHQGGAEMIVARPPEVVLEEARQCARALKTVLDQKEHKVEFGGEQYLEAEDWILLGRFYGVTAKIDWTRPVEYRDDVHGFEARAVALRADGAEVSAAEAMCLTDEAKWRARPRYAYCYVTKSGAVVEEEPDRDDMQWEPNPNKPGKSRPVKVRTLVGEEPVPLFQLRSMAQTRAIAKALAQVLRWIPVLAGYKGTPAEEMAGTPEEERTRPTRTRERGERRPREAETSGGGSEAAVEHITVKQLKVLFERAEAAGHTDRAQVTAYLRDRWHTAASTSMPAAIYEEVLARLDQTAPLGSLDADIGFPVDGGEGAEAVEGEVVG